MKDPSRWLSSEGAAPTGARELLRHGSAPKALDASTRAHHAALITKITAGAVGSAAAPTVVAGIKLSLATKVLATLGVVAAVALAPALHERSLRLRHEARPARAAVAAHPPSSPPRAAFVPPPVGPILALDDSFDHQAYPPSLINNSRESAPPRALPSSAPTSGRRALPAAAAPLAHAPVGSAEGVPPAASTVVNAPVAVVVDATPTETAHPSGSAGLGAAPTAPMPVLSEAEMLLAAAQNRRTDPAATLAELARIDREFPGSQFGAEREFIAVEALRDLGRGAEARTRAEALIARFPTSPYVARTRRLLGTLP